MDRIVRKIDPTPSKAQQDQPRPISAYDDAANIILLGDPGAGKTHTFRECASRCGGRYVTARTFLVTPATKYDGTLFIDGLDEKRAGRSDRDTVDALVERLFTVSPSKIRISCRVADWLGDTDIAALRPYLELSGEPVVLQLDRLTDEEQRAVLGAQGLSKSDADTFLRQANDHALGDFLNNPQNLIMLARAVQTGKWPTTRKELFELSTQLMLKVSDMDRARSGSGVYTVDELCPVAGAIFAARLISDVAAISLKEYEDSDAIPSYRSISIFPPENVIAALTRRIFATGPALESVDYAHRTTAEYLGAAWLADLVRRGMPLGRLQALMGVDGHPAPELRGLHAWLAVHLPEYVERLIDADPNGVLVYGDAASLTPSACAHLVRSLARLSERDPWFRSGTWHSPVIGALSRPDMVDEFRAVLRSPQSGFGIRSIVVEAAAMGAPMPDLKDDLVKSLLRKQSPYAERRAALTALLRIEPEGIAAVISAFSKLRTDVNALRLRSEIIERMYGRPFDSADITALVKDLAATTSSESFTGILYTLSQHMSVADIPAVLDALKPARVSRATYRNQWEVGRFIDQLLIRAWRGTADIEPSRALGWLRLRRSYASGDGGLTSDLRNAIRERPDLLDAIADNFFETLVPDKDRWLRLNRFRELTFFLLTPKQLHDHMITCMRRTAVGSDKELFLYEAALVMTYSMDELEADAAFEALFTLADTRDDLRAVRDPSLSCIIPSAILDRRSVDGDEDDEKYDQEEQRRNFEKDADAIRNGRHLGWLTWAAQVYLGLFSDVDEKARPRERLVSILGEANAQTATAGFIAALSRTDLPSLADVVALSAEHKRYDWWYVLGAGVIERWEVTATLAGLSDELLKVALAFDLTNPVFEHVQGSSHVMVPGWKTAVMRDRPELARDAYVAIARAKLTKGEQTVDGLRELMVEDAFKAFRTEIAFKFLRDFPNAHPYRLGEFFEGALATSAAHKGFLDLADRVLSGAVPVGEPQHDMWLAAAYVLAPSRYEPELEATAAKRPGMVFDLRNYTGYDGHSDRKPSELTLPQLEFLARLTGTLYPETPFPTGGWSGNTNSWDTAEYCRKLISAISAVPSEAATKALRRLEANAKMASYKPHLRHALANQEQRRREADYDRPDWPSTIKALSNGAPATVADLHALLLDQIDDLRKRIARENTDLYKSFWNLDRYSRLKSPRPEEACRDTLVTLLRPPLAPKGITVEPEGHMVADKRADISAAMPGRKILCELKRDYHADLWTAADEQLERFYAHDPEAKGFGIYGVLWFGHKRPSAMPRHPDGLKPPKSAAELEHMLRDRIAVDRRNRIAVVVIDVSGPPAPKPKRSGAKKKSPAAKKSMQRKSVRKQAVGKSKKKPARPTAKRRGSRQRRHR
jgi:predicted NACHT family NTPase